MRKLRDADAMLNAGKDLAAVLQALEVSESTYARWRSQYGGMKAEEAVRLKRAGGREQAAQAAGGRADARHPDAEVRERRETGEPFPEAGGGREAASGVRGLRAKGVSGDRSAAHESALPGEAAG